MAEVIGKTLRERVDWLLLAAILPVMAFGLLAMNSFTETSYFFNRQLIWIAVSLVAFFLASLVDWRFLRQSGVLVAIYGASAALLFLLFLAGRTVKGAQSWFDLGGVALQPADFIKIVVILLLAKYFSRRHVEIAHLRHILVSGIYAAIPFVLILLQPDLGSAVIIFLIWLGMIIFSGVSKKHLLAVVLLGATSFIIAWFFIFAPYQKARIMTFIHPLADIRGAGYNSFQSMIAVGSGQALGKGVGYGTQSRLEFLPEYETDFIFAAFAEEWGFVGVIFLFALYGIIIWRVVRIAMMGESNFESLFGIGLAILFISQFVINVGMNIGLLPVTGLTLPFMSYGGSHLLSEFIGLGILMGTRRYSRGFHRDDLQNEFLGVE
jgi:rod shape determining protein RodA